jgi:hypothetical protein
VEESFTTLPPGLIAALRQAIFVIILKQHQVVGTQEVIHYVYSQITISPLRLFRIQLSVPAIKTLLQSLQLVIQTPQPMQQNSHETILVVENQIGICLRKMNSTKCVSGHEVLLGPI